MYKVSATVIKGGQTPVLWMRQVKRKINQTQAIALLTKPSIDSYGNATNAPIALFNFKCEKV